MKPRLTWGDGPVAFVLDFQGFTLTLMAEDSGDSWNGFPVPVVPLWLAYAVDLLVGVHGTMLATWVSLDRADETIRLSGYIWEVVR